MLQLNAKAVKFVRLESLRAAALFFRLSALLGDALTPDCGVPSDEIGPQAEPDARWQDTREMVASLAAAVQVEEEARTSLERRYLDGHPALFGDAGNEWAGLRELIAGLGQRLTSIAPGAPAARRGAHVRLVEESTTERVNAQAAELADDGRVTAYELLGERERAVTIMERRLRAL